MGQRGRPSAASLAVVKSGDVTEIRRPSAPGELTSLEADQWRLIVDSMPADHFGAETHPMLVQLCRHKVLSDRIAVMIDQCDDLDDLNKLAQMQRGESQAIKTLETSLRLSQQSRNDRDRRKGSVAPRPWQKTIESD